MALIQNKKIGFEYEILEKLEAGIELLGFEVKSLREKHGSLSGAHIILRGNEAYIRSMTIPPYQPANTPPEYEPDRPRKLLLTRREIERLIGKEKEKGLTIVPVSVYNKRNKIKVEIAVVRGKKKYDKRQDIKKRESDREIRRTLKREY
jgi:SsrA-binding protein